MAKNYSQYDKLKGNETWGLPISLALAGIMLYAGLKLTQGENSELHDKRLGLEQTSVQTADVNDVNNIVYDNKSNYGRIK